MNMNICVCVCVYTHMNMYVCIYTFTHNTLHTHIHTCMGMAEELGFILVKSPGLDLQHYKNKEVGEKGGKEEKGE